jgi:glycosyltransferase 2 family protein
MKKTSVKKIALLILRAVLVIGPIAWIYARADAGTIVATLASASVSAVACATALLIVTMVLQGVKWWVLIHRFVPDLGVGTAVSVHFESNFYSIVLPSALAQDVVKSVMLSRSHSPQIIWASTWMAKLIGFFTLIILSVAGTLYLESESLPAGFRPSLIIAVVGIMTMIAASFSKRITRPLRAAAVRLAGPKIIASVEKLRDGIYAFKHERATLLQTFLISVVIQLLLVFNVSLVVYAVSGNFFLVECLAFVPLVEIMAISLPLTPGGLGIREALMALLFTRFGFSEGQTASYVTISLMLSMTRLVGGVPVIWKSFRRPPP